MKCYFFAGKSSLNFDNNLGIVSFAVPDVGVICREICAGDHIQLGYRSLLRLLRFLRDNRDSLATGQFDIFSDSLPVLYQLDGRIPSPKIVRPYQLEVKAVRKSIPFKLAWIPARLNRAAGSILELPALDIKLNYDAAVGGAGLKARKQTPFTRLTTEI
jgi:hypothetical protein